MQGDITRHPADAVVNAANSALRAGGGVCGAIHKAGGPRIAQDCAGLRAEQGDVHPGHAVATGAGRLKAQHVIHAVGPVWCGGEQREAETLASCYRESMRLADKLSLRSIAFPSIATGAFGYPADLAAPVALNAVAT